MTEPNATAKETPAAFARRLGIHRSSVTRAIQAGRLTLIDGMLDVADSLHRWHATQTGSRPDVAARHAAHRAAPIPEAHPSADNAPAPAPGLPAPPVEDPTAGSEPADSLAHYRKLTLAAEINLTKLAMSITANRRYPLAAIKRESLSLGGILRAALERLVDQTAPRLAVCPTQDDRRHLLASETRALRSLIKREIIRALRRLRAKA